MRKIILLFVFSFLAASCTESKEVKSKSKIVTKIDTISCVIDAKNYGLKRAIEIKHYYEGSLDITILEEKLIDVETSAWDGMHVFYNVKYVLKTTTINL